MSKPVPFWAELDGDSAEEWEDAFLERAAIMEYDGGMPRDEANRAAYRIVREQWRKSSPSDKALEGG